MVQFGWKAQTSGRAMQRTLAIVSVAAAVCIIGSASALADCHGDGVDAGEDTVHAGPGGSDQVGKWSLANRQVRVKVHTGNGLNSGRCLDSFFDWETHGAFAGHYDSRIVRDCYPGSNLESDPNGDGYWEEPSDWGSASVSGLNKGMGANYDLTDGAYVSGGREYFQQSEYYPNIAGTCAWTAAIPFDADHAWDHRHWLKNAAGAEYYNSGGDVTNASQ